MVRFVVNRTFFVGSIVGGAVASLINYRDRTNVWERCIQIKIIVL